MRRSNVMAKGESHCCDNSAVQFIPQSCQEQFYAKKKNHFIYNYLLDQAKFI